MKTPSASLSAILSVGLLLSACVNAPPTTPRVEKIAPQTLGLGSEPAPAVAPDWWTAFHDAQLDRLVALTLENSPTLAAALARMRSAEAVLSADRAADYPQANLDGLEQRQLFSKDYIIPPPYGGTFQWMGTINAGLDWNIDFWGHEAAIIDKARGNADAAVFDAAAARLALSGVFAQAYVNLMQAYEDGDIADQAVTERENILALTQKRFDSGLENRAALDEAKALLASARIDQTAAGASRETFVHALAALSGQGAEAYPRIARPTPALDTAIQLPANLPADLLARRPDVRAAEARVAAATAGRAAAHAAFFPNIDLQAFAGWSAIGLANMFTGNALDYGVGPAIHLPIFDAGKLRADYAGATADLDVSVADYNSAVLGAVRQTGDALTGVRAFAVEESEDHDALAAAQSAYDLAGRRYKSGLAGQLTLLDAEATLLAARQRAVALSAQSLESRIMLLLSVGGGFQPQQIAREDKAP